MDHPFRSIGGVVDSVLSIWRRLIVVLALFVCAGQAHAANTWQQAWDLCQAQMSIPPTDSAHFVNDHCGTVVATKRVGLWLRKISTGVVESNYSVVWIYVGADPANPCTGPDVPTLTGIFPGRILSSYSWCKSGISDPISGGTLSCVMSFTTSGPPTRNQWGSWSTPGTLASSGATCDGSGGGGSNNWSNPNGQPAGDPVPPSPDSNPPKAPPSKTCGGGSCYDPTNDNFCAVADGVQVCVPGGGARGDNGGANAGTPNGSTPGACSSSASATVCAGSPTAPKPSPSNVPDPPTQVVSNDTYTQANPTTGVPIVVQTTTYNSGSASSGASSPTSGQQSGDSGPASSSSTGGASSSYGGGGDCNTPPICTGDAALCGAARTQWATTCQVHQDLAGTGQPSDFGALKTKYSQSDVWSDTDTSMDGTEGGQANQGNYNQSGFGWSRACPLHDLTVPMGSLGEFAIPLADKCYVGEWLHALVVGFALFAAAIITAGGKGG